MESGRWDSNPRPSAWEADALPLSYCRNLTKLIWNVIVATRTQVTQLKLQLLENYDDSSAINT